MPGKVKKNLYLGKCMTDLNAKAGDLPTVSNVKICVTSAVKLFKNAEEHDMLGDEERAYVLYMKFFNFYSAFKRHAEYKKNERYYKDLIGVNNLKKAINKAEELSQSLKNRYEEREALEVSKKFEGLDLQEKPAKDIENGSKDDEVDTSNKTEGKQTNGQEKTEAVNPGCVSAEQLYRLILDTSTSVLIIDAREADDFSASHIRHKLCINVPTTIVKPGTTVRAIEPLLPQASRDLWASRATVSLIVLLDWRCRLADVKPGSILGSLKDALYKWDLETIVQSEPTILEGGYEEWLLYYPTLTTNAMVPRPPPVDSAGPSVPSLDSIDYDLDLNFLKSPEDLVIEETITEPVDKNFPMPAFDRSLKPPAGESTGAIQVTNNMVKPAVNKPTSSEKKNNLDQAKDMKKSQDVSSFLIKNKLDVAKNNLVDGGREGYVKDSNVIKQGNVDIPKPVMPSVDRSVKPRVEAQVRVVDPPRVPPEVDEDEDADDQSKIQVADTKDLEDEVVSQERSHPMPVVQRDPESAKQEFLRYQKEKERVVLEYRARLFKLNQEKAEIEKVKSMKQKEVTETADLMRRKKKVQEELNHLEALLAQKEADEATRKDELQRIQTEVENERKAREEQAAALQDKKKKEEEIIKREQIRQQEAAQKLVLQQNEERLLREQREQEIKKADELARKEAAEKEQLRREKEAAEAAAKTKHAQAPQPKLITPALPVGWEKKLDPSTGRYFFVNHRTKHTQWHPPESAASQTAGPGVVYRTKLKDAPDESSGGGGLKRSHSSPNIAKMMHDEDQGRVVQPSVERVKKPKPSRDAQAPLIINTQVTEVEVRNLQPTWGNVKRGLTGLRNLGNTCYMNSIIQALSNTAPLTRYFLTNLYRDDINRDNMYGNGGDVAEEYAVVIKALWCAQYKAVSPRDFKGTVAKHHELFQGYSQQDSQELLLFLMDGLHEDLNTVRKRPILPEQNNDGLPDVEAADKAWQMHKKVHASIIVELFQGQFKSTVQCLTCDKKSVTFDAFMYLTLPIASSTKCSIKDCVKEFSAKEKMTGDSRWSCPRCRCKRDAVKHIVIWRLPPILLIHLKRFYYQGMWRQKITAYVDFPLEGLNMNDFLAGNRGRQPYALYAVSNHYGTIDGGHYTANCRNPNSHKWYKYDDHDVNEMSKSDCKTSAAYILFYSCINMEPLFKEH